MQREKMMRIMSRAAADYLAALASGTLFRHSFTYAWGVTDAGTFHITQRIRSKPIVWAG